MRPAMLALTETRLTEDIEDTEINMSGYNVYRCDSENRGTGGVMIYVRNDIKCESEFVTKIKSNCWCIGITLNNEIYNGIILVVYHSPSASDSEFISFIINMSTSLYEYIIMSIINEYNKS